MKEEIWKPVLGQEGLFEISSMGNVRSYKGIGRNNKIMKEPHPIKPCIDGRGYLNFTIRVDGKPKVLSIHTELAKSFVPNPENNKLVRHLDDIKTNNTLRNIAWGTHSDNTQDALRNKKHPKRNDFSHALILYMYNCEHNACSVARRFNVSPSMVTKIRTGISYSWLTGHTK